MSLANGAWRSHVSWTLQHGCVQRKARVTTPPHAQPSRTLSSRARWKETKCLLPALHWGCHPIAPLTPGCKSSESRTGLQRGRKPGRSWGLRCLVGEVQNSGLRERLLEPEAAGITTTGKFSISDEDFSKEGLRFNGEGDSVDLNQLNGLFGKVGFPHRKQSKLRIALRNTLAMVWLLDTEQDRLIAFARATGDAVFNATIWDVVVDPGWQKKGLGKAVIERLMADLLNRGIVNINLYAEPNVVSFYKPLGFVTDPSGISGMALNKKKAAL